MAVTKNQPNRGALGVSWAALYFAGLACVLLGERVLVEYASVSTVVSGVGLVLSVGSTAARLTRSGGAGARGEIGRLLGFAQLAGVVGLAVYWVNALWVAPGKAPDPVGLHEILTVVWVTLVAVGVTAVLFGEWSLQGMRDSAHVESSRVSFAVQSGAALALAAAYGSLFVYSAAQQEAKADFSYFKTSKPGEATLKIVDQIGDKVTVTAFFPEVNEVRREVAAYLGDLQKRNPGIQVRLVDRYLEPKLASELSVTRDGVLVFAREENRQSLSVGTDLNKARATLRKLDEEVHARLMKLLREKKLAYLTTGHGELNDKANEGAERGAEGRSAEGRSAEIFKQVVEQGNLRLQDLGLGQGLARTVPEDADVLIVLGPTSPFTPEEIASVRRYAEGGGKVLLALDADVQGQSLTGTADRQWQKDLANAVGATFVPVTLADEERYVVRRNNLSDRLILPTTRFSSHASVTTLGRNPTRGVVVLGASHLIKGPESEAKSDVAMRTFNSAFEDKNGDFQRNEGESKQEFTLAMALSREIPGAAKAEPEAPRAPGEPKPEAPEMRAFVVADADVFSDLLMPRVPGNPVLAFDAVRWLIGEESLAGQMESEEDVRVEQTKQMNMAWFYSTVLGVPIVVLIGGVLISRRGQKARSTTQGAKA